MSMTAVAKERPIIFSPESVLAVLAGCKTQTRRALNPQPFISASNPPRFSDTKVGDIFICPDLFPTEEMPGLVLTKCESTGTYHSMGVKQFVAEHCPYGEAGNYVWVREPFKFTELREAMGIDNWYLVCRYKADGKERFIYECDAPLKVDFKAQRLGNARHAMFMPRWASRILLAITDIHIERVQDISEDDAKAEGISGDGVMYQHYGKPNMSPNQTARSSYCTLWDHINGTRDDGIYAWNRNPWVYALSFEVMESVMGCI